jgi:hypothetical protein
MPKFTRSETDRANKSDALKAYWARVRYFENSANREKLSASRSSWWAACADALESFDLEFDRGGRVDLVDCSWHPDFLVTIDDADFYLEVKGHPLAVAQFEQNQLPCIHHAPLPVAILARAPPYPTELDRFLDLLDWLHYY